MTHTEGPWSTGHMTSPDHPCECRYIFSPTHMGCIAIVSKDDGSNDCPVEAEAIDNAKLIAAAPQMYHALENLESDDGAIPDHAWNLVQAALKQARGETL